MELYSQKDGLYIAGPECFYPRGYELWWAQRKLAEYYGYHVVMPTDTPLKLDASDLRLNAMEIFEDLKIRVRQTGLMIADLEMFRGCEPDAGTVFEMGMVYADYGRIYGYTRDSRSMIEKNQQADMRQGVPVDQYGWPHPYGHLPFCPSIIGSAKIIEGSFSCALKVMTSDLLQEKKDKALGMLSCRGKAPQVRKKKPIALYFSSPRRYAPDTVQWYSQIKTSYESDEIEVWTPLDYIEGLGDEESTDPYIEACFSFNRWQSLVRNCDVLVADLSDFHGLEPNNDVAFECGLAFQLGKLCIGFREDNRIMRERIPHGNVEGHDMQGNTIENFNLPMNLMFSASMKILEGTSFSLRDQIFAMIGRIKG